MAPYLPTTDTKKLLLQLFLLCQQVSSLKISPIHVINFHFQKYSYCAVWRRIHYKARLLFAAIRDIPVNSWTFRWL